MSHSKKLSGSGKSILQAVLDPRSSISDGQSTSKSAAAGGGTILNDADLSMLSAQNSANKVIYSDVVELSQGATSNKCRLVVGSETLITLDLNVPKIILSIPVKLTAISIDNSDPSAAITLLYSELGSDSASVFRLKSCTAKNNNVLADHLTKVKNEASSGGT